jgi:hypothetical protein
MDGGTSKLLDELVADRVIEQLERGLEKFNIFAALGVERSEVQHSNFLAYLLSPWQKHGFEDRFLRKFLQAAIKGCVIADVQVTPIDIDTWELGDVDVQRERRNTDIFATDGRHFAMVIENKIDSSEHDHQLARYRSELKQDFPKLERLLFYLTPAGAPPEENEERKFWIAVDYGCVAKVLQEEIIAFSEDLHLNNEIVFALQHYLEVLRRYIVTDSDDAKRCRAFYRRHRVALDLINELVNQQRVLLLAEARRFLEQDVREDDRLELEQVTNTEMWFAVRQIDRELPRGGTDTKSGRILIFDIWIEQGGISFVVQVGPGPEEARRELFRIAGIEPFVRYSNLDGFLKIRWNTIYKRPLIKAEDYTLEKGDFLQKLKNEWQVVKTDDLPKIEGAIQRGLTATNPNAEV